ncbi:MAG TPA: type II secretion system minor pseudopilin GspI [Marinobacter sp.]|nr:type II secretion system minor pseudopilin GspI [Marinobacter sp.]
MKVSRGFTLIEVLVALLVFGLITSTAVQVGSQYISSYERIRDKTLAAWIADNRINEIRLEESLPAVSENSRDSDFGPFRWRVTTKVIATAEPSMRRIEVTAARYRDGQSAPVPVHTLAAFVGKNG